MQLSFLPRRLRRFSFKSKLFLSYMLIVLIPVSISGVWIYDQVIVPIRGERLLLIEQAMSQLQATVDKEVDDIENTGYLISTNIVLKKSLLKRYYDESEIIEVMNTSIQSLLSWFEATHKDIGDFHFFTVNETLPESNFFMPLSDVSDQPWYVEMAERIRTATPYWEPSHIQRDYPYSRNSDQPVYSMFYPINEDFPNDTSYLEFEIDLNHFFSRLQSLVLSKSGIVLAIDQQGQLIYSPESDSELANGVTGLPAFHQVDTMTAGSGDITYNGATYRYVVKPIDRLHTSLVGLIPIYEIDGPWIETKNVFIMLILFLTVLLAVLSFLLAGLLIKKIIVIVGSVRRIQNGNFKVRIPVNGEDEIDWLAVNINSMAGQIDDLINRVYKSQVSQKEAELIALQAQINPHFLFNALETLRMMAETRDQSQLSDAIAALGSIMRYNISSGRDSVTLATEIEHIDDYVQIQNLLHNNRITFHSSIPDSLLNDQIPNLLLQPLVENCIIHGMKGHVGNLLINIHIVEVNTPAGPVIRCTVKDNGSGIALDRLEQIWQQLKLHPDQRLPLKPEADKPGRSGGMALINVSNRIHYFYGSASTMEVSSTLDDGTVVTLTLPIEATT
jgi:two-component system sensor histidine kinase YesM